MTLALFSLMTGCTNLPFLKGALSASPTPAASEDPASSSAEPESQVIEGHVGNGTPGPTAPMAAIVHIAGMAFAPSQVTIGQGGTVTFINDDSMPHSVVPRTGAQFTGSDPMGQGQQVTITFPQTGDQPYACGFHPSMEGTVTVQAP